MRRSTGRRGSWTVSVWSGKAGEIALGKVEDGDGRVSEAWTGPQVAWKMARGRVGSFGGKVLNAWWTWIPLSAALPRRPRRPAAAPVAGTPSICSPSLSFGFSLWFFNRGEVFRSAPLAAPPLVYLLVRTAWIGFRGRALNSRALLAGVGARGGGRLSRRVPDRPQSREPARRDRRRLRGRDRRRPDPQRPGAVRPHARRGRRRRACGKADAEGEIRDRIQAERPLRVGEPARRHVRACRPTSPTSRRCSSFGWSGKWDSLPGGTRDGDRVRPARRARPAPRRPSVRRRAARASRSRSAGSRSRSPPTR